MKITIYPINGEPFIVQAQSVGKFDDLPMGVPYRWTMDGPVQTSVLKVNPEAVVAVLMETDTEADDA